MPDKLSEFLFTNVGVPRFEAYLDLAGFRHKLISGNVANVSTPGYRSRSMNFQAEFERLTESGSKLTGKLTHDSHLPLGQHKERSPDVQEAAVAENGLSSVDIDREIADLAQNELHYTIAAKLLQRKFQGLKNAITSK